MHSPFELAKTTGIELQEAEQICSWAHNKMESSGIIHKSLCSAEEFYSSIKDKCKISTGSQTLDRLLYGGIERRSVTEFYGVSASGKTQICFTLSVMVQQSESQGGLEGRVIYMDTEHKFSPERIVEIANARRLRAENILSNIRLLQPFNSLQQERNLKDISKIMEQDSNIKFLVVDSVINHYRSEYIGRKSLSERQQRLNIFVNKLSKIAQVYDVAVVTTNHVQAIPDSYSPSVTSSTGGNVIAHTSTYRIQLTKSGPFNRVARITNSPSHSPLETAFTIGNSGVEDIRE